MNDSTPYGTTALHLVSDCYSTWTLCAVDIPDAEIPSQNVAFLKRGPDHRYLCEHCEAVAQRYRLDMSALCFYLTLSQHDQARYNEHCKARRVKQPDFDYIAQAFAKNFSEHCGVDYDEILQVAQSGIQRGMITFDAMACDKLTTHLYFTARFYVEHYIRSSIEVIAMPYRS